MHACLVASVVSNCDPMDRSPPGSSVCGILKENYWSGLPFPPPGALPDPGIELTSPALQADSLPLSRLGNPTILLYKKAKQSD